MKEIRKTFIFRDLSKLAPALCLLFTIQSCATKKDRDFIEVEASQVEKSLGVDKTKLGKFAVIPGEEESADRLTEKAEKAEKTEKTENKNDPVHKKEHSQIRKATKSDKTSVKVDEQKQKNNQSTSSEKVEATKNDKEISEVIRDEVNPYPEAFPKYDAKSEKIWPLVKPKIFVGEKFTFKVGYLGITAGYIQLTTEKPVKIGAEDVFHFSAKMRSARYYSYIYSLDDSISSYVRKKDFIPMKYVLAQRESSQTVDDLQLFDTDDLKTYHWYKRIKHGKLKEVELSKYIPRYFQDSYSALHFVRALPLEIGDVYEFPIVTRGKIWILKLKVEREEKIEVMDEEIAALRINAETRFPGVLEKRGDILFWFSADKYKKLLKFEAQVKIGSISGEIVEYQSGESN